MKYEILRYLTVDETGEIKFVGVVQMLDYKEGGFMLRAAVNASTSEELDSKVKKLLVTLKSKVNEIEDKREKIKKFEQVEE